MAYYFDVTRTYLTWSGAPTGVARTLYGLCAASANLGVRAVVFHPGRRRWYRLPHFHAVAGPARRLRSRARDLERHGESIELGAGDVIYLLDLNLTSVNGYGNALRSVKAKEPSLEIVGFVHDIFPLRYPDRTPESFRRYFGEWLAFLEETCDRVFTNSREVADSLLGRFPGRDVRAVRFGSAVDTTAPNKSFSSKDLLRVFAKEVSAEAIPALRDGDGWILSVGVLTSRKNHRLQIDALEPLWQSGELRTPLIFAGRLGGEAGRLAERVRASPTLRKFVTLLGPVPDDGLWNLYRGARLSLLTSIYEGFGLPVSESLQFGCPCFAARVGGIPEVAADLVPMFDPTDAGALRALIRRFFAEPDFERGLREAAARFRPFTWRQTVEDLTGLRDTAISVRDVDEPIDVVYTWCDDRDPEFSAELARYRKPGEGSLPSRFRNHDELKYSLRSLETFAPWVRQVFLVTSGQVPAWLRRDHPRLRLVTHREIFPASGVLPTFNSLAIELNLFRIPDLAEHFLYLNDDFFLGDTLRKASLFSSRGEPVFFVSATSLPSARRGLRGLFQREDLMKRIHRFNHRLLDNRRGGPLDARNPVHAPQLYRKTQLGRLYESFPREVSETEASRFRKPRNVKVSVLYPYIAGCRTRRLWNGTGEYVFKMVRDEDVDGLEDSLAELLRERPTFFCLNDDVLEERLSERADRHIRGMLERYFPRASSFERG